jgi:hypothetical protein
VMILIGSEKVSTRIRGHMIKITYILIEFPRSIEI